MFFQGMIHPPLLGRHSCRVGPVSMGGGPAGGAEETR